MAETGSLMDGLLDEMNRVRDLIAEYRRLPNNVGFIGASLMQLNIQEAENSIREGDVVKMLVAYDKLKNCE